MYSIGEFSKMTVLSIKSLRLYHEKGILVPASIDSSTGYRYYNNENFDTAKAIKVLRQFDFSINEIKEVLDECKDESDIIGFLETKQNEIESKLKRYSDMSRSIEQIIRTEKEAVRRLAVNPEIIEKEYNPILIAGYRMKGRYEEVGKGYHVLRRAMGLYISGKPMVLYYDGEYKEEADFEPCFPIRNGKGREGISVRELPGGKAVTLIHKGRFERIGESYRKIFSYIHEKEYAALLPTREVYLKGPGLIFRGNPKRYLTEILIFVS